MNVLNSFDGVHYHCTDIQRQHFEKGGINIYNTFTTILAHACHKSIYGTTLLGARCRCEENMSKTEHIHREPY